MLYVKPLVKRRRIVKMMMLMSMIKIRMLKMIWLVGCFGFNSPLRQYFSLYRAVSQREGERKEKI